ncbi:hypothetical protein ACI6PO_06505 [Agrobacterium tumefaciens]
MIAFAPYALALSGCWLLLLAVIITANGAFHFFASKVAPALIGAASLWFSAMMIVAEASR